MSEQVYKTPAEIAHEIVGSLEIRTIEADNKTASYHPCQLAQLLAEALAAYGSPCRRLAIQEAEQVACNILAEARDIDGEDASLCGELQDDIGSGILALLTKVTG